ncbi:MAG: hypothetical protein JWN62_4556 [Acidimicrobiales bacterium]|nr:hypothetical protein [Acidimicrobiales bacterium]
MRLPNRHILEALASQSSRPERVVELLQSFEVAPDTMLTMIGAEVWTTYFILRWEFRAAGEDPVIDRRLTDGLAWTATDDLGTDYVGGDFGGGGGNSRQWTYSSTFAPALDPMASLLDVVLTSPVNGEPTPIRLTIPTSGRLL